MEGKKIFLAVLDWGMGHATRMNPVIRRLMQTNTIILGVTPSNRFYFQQQFPDLEKIELPSYAIRYSRFLPVWLKIVLDWPRIRRVIQKEHALIQKIVLKKSIDVIISDSRFGLYSTSCHSIIVSHQLQLQTPFKNNLAGRLNKKMLEKFSEIWVPDYEDRRLSLAGNLSLAADYKIPVVYLGPISALVKKEETESPHHTLVLLSGPEPQRSELESRLRAALSTDQKKVILIRGTQQSGNKFPAHFTVRDFCAPEELRDFMCAVDIIICRSGYSTLMDLHVLQKKKIILVPTPGQTEQEYLADYWQKKFGAVYLKQERIVKELPLLLKTH